MPRKFVDLSIFLENDVLSDPPAFAPKIQYFTHEQTYEQRTCRTGRAGRWSWCSSRRTTARTSMRPITSIPP
jgi:hypothetical protein